MLILVNSVCKYKNIITSDSPGNLKKVILPRLWEEERRNKYVEHRSFFLEQLAQNIFVLYFQIEDSKAHCFTVEYWNIFLKSLDFLKMTEYTH